MTLEQYLSKTSQTATAFADKLGVSQVTVSRYLNGKRFPDKAMILRIQEASGGKVRPVDWFASAAPEAAE